MDIFVYSDESGVFDQKHNDFFVYGGIVFLSKNQNENWKRKYLSVERKIKSSEKLNRNDEAKATNVSNKSKGKLFRALNYTEKFGVVIQEKNLRSSIFQDKKTKQRYLDYAYKRGVKQKFEDLISRGVIVPEEINNINFFVDEHTTATNGRYELQESLFQEFKYGTHNWNYQKFFPPIFPNVKNINVYYCNSKKKTLVRASDIIANRLYFYAKSYSIDKHKEKKFSIIHLP